MDSLGTHTYYEEVAQDLSKFFDKKLEKVYLNSPKQINTYDCGIHLLHAVEGFVEDLQGWTSDWNQNLDSAELCKRVLAELESIPTSLESDGHVEEITMAQFESSSTLKRRKRPVSWITSTGMSSSTASNPSKAKLQELWDS